MKGVRSLSKLPEFPPKKLFGNKDRDFLHQRQSALEYFFNTLFEMKGILDEVEVFKYIRSKCENEDKLNDIIDAYKG